MERGLVTIAAVLLLIACGSERKAKPVDVSGQKLYKLTGKIVSRSGNDNTVRVDHDAIPGFMDAMTMDYSVRGTRVESLPADGTRIEARLHGADDFYWLSDVKAAPDSKSIGGKAP